MSTPQTIAVIGAGTMGSGIAQLAATPAGARTLLHDPLPEALARGRARIEKDLRRLAERGKVPPEEVEAALGRLHVVDSLGGLADADLIIEAAPERLELKRELFSTLEGIVSERCVLASNTSSLLVTAVAAGLAHPERVVGMHFFNPAPVMRLLEVVAGVESGEEALALARATGQAMGKTCIDATDGPGFLVNRCNRPFNLEAMKLLTEGVADIRTIDRIMRLAGGFRMGAFELMDLVGIDVGFEVGLSFHEQSFGEPRWRPSPVSVRQIASGRLGRKTGRGFYDYSDGAHRPDDPEPPAAGGGEGLVVISGGGVLADELRELAAEAGWEVVSAAETLGELAFLILDCGEDDEYDEESAVAEGGPRAILCDAGSLAALDPAGPAVGFHALPPLAEGRLIELTRQPTSSELAVERSERFFSSLGRHLAWVGDAPGLVLGRLVSQLVNEAAFALTEGVGSAADIDTGMVLGLNHPRGPLTWADAAGLDHVLTILDALREELGEERYRAAPLLRRLYLQGRLGAAYGQGFHDYE
ncbi:MAG TPA: 3-hydroxyacyl-CoA dehydrogenase NAD-binding domain-containing protein [Solirubrobacteraceae bacterium]|jgi:3-hydroxybutyryl-CoA dehydrogenase|nr:3-hydroxyacyl-CoA dehydrogenase NAD-binding domain-containing protein [Solirubrobacteraceae bacterium]